jgi:molybdopterin/thiamine biosynthesis adenylyltransferase
MQSTFESDRQPGAGKPTQWAAWAQTPRDVAEARSLFIENPLKGMPGSAGSLSESRAIVFGVGATGGVASSVLAQSGIGDLDLVDPDSYGTTSFMTQPTSYQHRGHPKALVQGERAQRINPACRVRAAVSQAQDLLLRDLRKPDLFLVAGDNLSLLIWAGRMAVALGKPLIQAAVHGETGSAFVRSYSLRDASSACPMCGMSERELSDQEGRFGCDIDTSRPTNTEATRTIPAICQAAGIFAATEAIKWLAGRHDLAIRGEELVCSMFAYQTWRTELPRNPVCRLPHAQWQLEDLPAAANQTTLGCLAGELGMNQFQKSAQVRSEIPWVSFTFCGSCGRKASVLRFARVGSAVGRCRCDAPLTPVPQGLRSVIPSADLMSCWDKPIASLGIESGEPIGILRGAEWVYFFTSDDNTNQGHQVG